MNDVYKKTLTIVCCHSCNSLANSFLPARRDTDTDTDTDTDADTGASDSHLNCCR
jgi:hypothetical protein